MKNLWAWLAIVVVIVGGWYALSGKSTNSSGKEIVIGQLTNVTGFGSSWGVGEEKAVALRVKELKAEGLNIKLISEDCASDIPKCVSAAQKLISVDKAVAIVGPQWTEWFEAVAPIAKEAKVTMISPSGLSDVSYQPYVFSLGVSYEGWAKQELKFAKERNAKKAIIITTANAFMDKVTENVKRLASDYGVVIADDVHIANPDEKDFSTVIAKMKLQKPDLIIVNLVQPQGIPFIKKAKEQGIAALIVYPGGQTINETTVPILTGTYMVDFTMSDTMNAKFKAEYGSTDEVAPSTQTAYDAMSLVGAALKAGARTSEAIADSIRAIKDYAGLTGIINFDGNGYAAWDDGVFIVKEIK